MAQAANTNGGVRSRPWLGLSTAASRIYSLGKPGRVDPAPQPHLLDAFRVKQAVKPEDRWLDGMGGWMEYGGGGQVDGMGSG